MPPDATGTPPGFDLGSVPEVAATLAEATDTGLPRATPAIRLGPPGAPAVCLVLEPLFTRSRASLSE